MTVAQQLYEGPAGSTEGLITYMRTDGTFIAEEALAAIRAHIGAKWVHWLLLRLSSRAWLAHRRLTWAAARVEAGAPSGALPGRGCAGRGCWGIALAGGCCCLQLVRCCWQIARAVSGWETLGALERRAGQQARAGGAAGGRRRRVCAAWPGPQRSAPVSLARARRAPRRFGSAHLPAEPRRHASRAKNSQEAHEAIRPADVAITPDSLPPALEPDQRRLYALIWRRTLACQMSAARFRQVPGKGRRGGGGSGAAPALAGYGAMWQPPACWEPCCAAGLVVAAAAACTCW
jgi:hypothetical protein